MTNALLTHIWEVTDGRAYEVKKAAPKKVAAKKTVKKAAAKTAATAKKDGKKGCKED